MTQYNTLNIKLFNSQLNKLKSAKMEPNLSSNKIGDCNDENNFPLNLLLTNHKFQSFAKLLKIILQLI